MARERQSAIKDLLMGTFESPKTDEEINEKTKDGKSKLRIRLIENPFRIDEIHKELNLSVKRLNDNSEFKRENEGADDQALLMYRFKGKCCNCGKLGHYAAQCTLRSTQERL